MCKVPERIYDMCPSCYPRSYVMTVVKYENESEHTGEFIEYLYSCEKCGARIWVDKSWAVSHAAVKRSDDGE